MPKKTDVIKYQEEEEELLNLNDDIPYDVLVQIAKRGNFSKSELPNLRLVNKTWRRAFSNDFIWEEFWKELNIIDKPKRFIHKSNGKFGLCHECPRSYEPPDAPPFSRMCHFDVQNQTTSVPDKYGNFPYLKIYDKKLTGVVKKDYFRACYLFSRFKTKKDRSMLPFILSSDPPYAKGTDE